MINGLVVSLIVSIFSIEYLVRDKQLLHPYLILIPELLSAIAMIIVLARLMSGCRVNLDGRYLAFVGLLIFTMIFGFLTQDVPTGAVVAGIRAHLKFIPFFLLPAVYRFSARDLQIQLLVLLALLVVQVPLAVYQRFIEFAHMMDTGDPVKGTATTSSALSLLMIGGIACMVSLYLRSRIKLWALCVFMALFFLPTMLNETKATFLLIPVALFLPALLMPKNSGAFRKLMPVAALGVVAAVSFVVVYDQLIAHRQYGQPILEFFTSEGINRYLYTRGAEEELNYIGRFDSIAISLEHISREPARLGFGLGAGNVSTSFLPQFDGAYAAYFDRYGVDLTQITNFLWQIGVVGLLLYVAFYGFVAFDALKLARSSESRSLLGQIWFVVIAIMTFALVYKSVFSMNEIGYLFWLYSGVVAAEVVRLRRLARDVSTSQRSSRGRQGVPQYLATAQARGRFDR